MPYDPLKQPPFLTRENLAFENAAVFRLKLTVRASGAGDVYVTGATKEGAFTFKQRTIGLGNIETFTFGIPDMPIWVSAFDIDSDYSPGQCFVSVDLQINGNSVHKLFQGYIYYERGLSWPLTFSEYNSPVRGFQTGITGANPAAGASILDNVPDNFHWLLKAVYFDFVTDSTAVTRQVYLNINTDGANYMPIPAAASQAASLTREYLFLAGYTGPSGLVGQLIITGIPAGIVLNDNGSISTYEDNDQAGDNFGAPIYSVETFVGESP